MLRHLRLNTLPWWDNAGVIDPRELATVVETLNVSANASFLQHWMAERGDGEMTLASTWAIRKNVLRL